MRRTWPKLLASALLLGTLGWMVTSGTNAPAQAQSPGGNLAGVQETDNILFRTIEGDDLFMDAYSPPTGGKHPAVVAIHGGGFARGIRATMRQTCGFLAQNGYACFSVDYRLAPNYDPVKPGQFVPKKPRIDGPGYPAQIEDIQAAIEFIRKHAEEFGVDALRIATLGTSAGGTLSLMIGAESQRTHSAGWEVAAAASWSGPAAFSANAEESLGNEFEPGSKHALQTYVFGEAEPDLQGSENGDPSIPDVKEVERADPYTHLTLNSAPVFLANSQDERVPIQMPERYGSKLGELGVPNEVDIFPGRQHALGLLLKARQPTLQFFEEHVRGFTGFEPQGASPEPTTATPTPTDTGGSASPSLTPPSATTPRPSRIPGVLIAAIVVLVVVAVLAIALLRRRGRPSGW